METIEKHENVNLMPRVFGAVLYFLMAIAMGINAALSVFNIFIFSGLLVLAVLFFMAAIQINRSQKWAVMLAVLGLAGAWIYYISILVSAFYWNLSSQLVQIPELLLFTLPLLVLIVATSYSLWLWRHPTENEPLWFHSRGAKGFYIVLVPVIFAILVANLFFLNQTKLVTYEMSWETDGIIKNICNNKQGYQDGFELEFVDEPGFNVEFCTNGALAYLETIEQETVPVTFRVSYDVFAFKGYSIAAVGEWQGEGVRRFGSLPCINYQTETTRGTKCGGKTVLDKTREMFGYFEIENN